MLQASAEAYTAAHNATQWELYEERLTRIMEGLCERSFAAGRPLAVEIGEFCDWWVDNGGDLDKILNGVHGVTSLLIRRRLIDISTTRPEDRATDGMALVALVDDIAATFHAACTGRHHSAREQSRHLSHGNARVASRMTFDLPTSHRVEFCAMVVDVPDLDRAQLTSLVDGIADSAAVVDFSQRTPRILASLADSCAAGVCERMRISLGDNARISLEPITPRGWFRSFRTADRVMNLAVALDIKPGVHQADDFPIEFAAARTGVVRDHLVSTLEGVMSKDDLKSTLLSLVRCEGNRTRAAAELDIHRSTIDYRLDRIKKITSYSPLTLAGLNMLSTALAVYILTV